jgi:hypothetical protein
MVIFIGLEMNYCIPADSETDFFRISTILKENICNGKIFGIPNGRNMNTIIPLKAEVITGGLALVNFIAGKIQVYALLIQGFAGIAINILSRV